MKIRINQDIVEFTPENPAEKTELEALWIKMAAAIAIGLLAPCFIIVMVLPEHQFQCLLCMEVV